MCLVLSWWLSSSAASSWITRWKPSHWQGKIILFADKCPDDNTFRPKILSYICESRYESNQEAPPKYICCVETSVLGIFLKTNYIFTEESNRPNITTIWRHRNFTLHRFLLETSFHCSLAFTFVTFLIHCPLHPAASSVSWCRYCFVCSGLTYEIYSGGGPSTFVYCVICYCVIAAPYVRSVVMSLHTVILLMTIRNVQWTMSFLYCLLKVSSFSESLRITLINASHYKRTF